MQTRQYVAGGILAIGLLWPVVGDRVTSWVVPDRAGCAHSSDMPRPGSVKESRDAVLCLLNRERERMGLTPLSANRRLERAAQAHAADMGRRQFYDHVNPDGVEPDQRMRAEGYDGAATGENIAWAVREDASASRIMQSWMNSPGHRANILNPSFTEVGVGVAHTAPERDVVGTVGVYVQNFGAARRRSLSKGAP